MHEPFCRRLPDVVLLVVAGWLVAVPLGLPWLSDHTVHDSARAAQLALAALCALSLLLTMPAAIARRPSLPSILLMGSGFVAIVGAERFDMAWREAAVFGGMASVVMLVATTSLRQLLAWPVAIATGLYASLVLLVGLLAGADAAPVQHAELVIGYANRRHFNHVQTVAYPLCVWIGATADARLLRQLAIIAAGCTLALLFVTLGRATGLGLAIGLAITMAVARPAARVLTKPAATSVLLGAALYGLVFHLWPWVFGHDGRLSADLAIDHLASDQSRLGLWQWALDAWREAPWFGIGPMHLSQRFNGIVAHPHSFPLQILSEWGAIFAAAAVWLTIRFLRRLQAGARHRVELAALLWVVVAVMLDSTVSGNVVMPVSQVWIAVALGWALGAVDEIRPRTLSIDQPRLAKLGGALLWICVLWLPLALAFRVAVEWPNLTAHIESTLEQFPSTQYHPRFWSHGWF